MEFEVSVFDSSHCDREYAEYLQGGGGGGGPLSVEQISKKFEFKKAATRNRVGQSHVVCKVRAYCLSRYYFRLPGKFAKANGLINKKCVLIIRDEKQRSWILKLYTSCSQVYIGSGWAEFRDANDIKEGDHITFKVVTNGEMPIWKFRNMRGTASPQPEGKEINLDAKSVSMEATGVKTETSYVTTPKAQVPASTSTNDTNPHFISIIKPYSICKHVLYIPLAFAKSNGWMNRCCEMLLVDEQWRSWPVRLGPVSDHQIGIHIGWQKFKEANDVQVGDIYRFELISNGNIPVAYFHPITTENPKLNIKSSHGIFPKVEAAEGIPLGYPHFIYTITPYCLSRDRVQLPDPFARENGLMDRKCTITIRDEQWSWPFALHSSGEHTYIKGIWHTFCIANRLKEGDQIMLEIVENGINPILRFHDLRANASLQLKGMKPNLDAKKVSCRRIGVPASTSANANSQFVSIIQPYAIIRALFYLPSAFARPNGLMRRCKMMLRDEKQRLWPVQLGEVGPRFAITKGWRQFREANAVQVGDSYKFELINNGIIPIAYFRPVRANATFQPEGKKPNLDTKRVSTLANASTQFISTIRPYCIRNPCLYLPSAFAKSNGLVNRRCEMILRDEKQRSWAVCLAPMGHRIAITRGWQWFREANDVQVGDTYKLELIDNGMIPIVYFHCKYSGKDAKASEKPLTNTNQQLLIYNAN